MAERFPRVHCIRSEANLGVAGGRNLGAEHAGGRFPGVPLAFLDNDAWPEPGAYRAMLRVMKAHPEAGLIAPKVYRPWSPVVIAAIGGHHINWRTGTIRSVGAGEVDEGQYDAHVPITCNGGACLVRREVFTRVGGFDEGFNPYGWEDVDFALRARSAGFHICLAPTAIIYHEGGRAGRGRSLPEYERSKTRGYFRLIRRHATRGQWLCCVCLLPFRAAGRALSEVLHGHWRIPFAHVRGALAARRPGVEGSSENRVGKLG